MPAPQPQTRLLVLPPTSLGRSGWFSQTQPVSSHFSHFIVPLLRATRSHGCLHFVLTTATQPPSRKWRSTVHPLVGELNSEARNREPKQKRERPRPPPPAKEVAERSEPEGRPSSSPSAL